MKSTVGQTFHGSQTLVTVYMPSWWALQGLGSSFPYHCHLRPKSVCEFFLMLFSFLSLLLPGGRWGVKFLFFSHYYLTI